MVTCNGRHVIKMAHVTDEKLMVAVTQHMAVVKSAKSVTLLRIDVSFLRQKHEFRIVN